MNAVSKNLLDTMVRYGIGLDPWFFERNAEAPNFPPHNIIQLEPDRYLLTLAVAGFQPEELTVTVERDVLTVAGHKIDEPDKEGRQVLYRGIAFRDFSRQFKIGENVRVQQADLRHGLLNITLVREIPDAQKPKLIQITS